MKGPTAQVRTQAGHSLLAHDKHAAGGYSRTIRKTPIASRAMPAISAAVSVCFSTPRRPYWSITTDAVS